MKITTGKQKTKKVLPVVDFDDIKVHDWIKCFNLICYVKDIKHKHKDKHGSLIITAKHKDGEFLLYEDEVDSIEYHKSYSNQIEESITELIDL